MNIYDIPNINHCDVEAVGSLGYTITAHEGWFIHLNDGDEETTNIWKGAVVLLANTDWSIVEIRAEADLPEGAEYDNITEGGET